ncbi:MAG: AarF/ABC1/UbiB kinase family protein [Actinomycetota bacterium]|nr:AarF/ABC1/UbiB kinase family protein [Actinomycetota bacterium]
MPKARTVAAIAGIVAAATAGAIAVQEARKRNVATAGGGPVLGSTRGARNAALAGVGAKAGGQYAIHRAKRAFASAERQKELDAQFELQTAESITEALGNMKGAMMKLGQMASYLDQGMPEPVREALAELQSNAPPMSAELSAQVIRDELGAAPDEVFETWDPAPIASASIGQVHRAITKDGRAVAVKVQYPGVGDAIRADLDNAGLLFGVMGMLFPGLEPEPLVEELRDRLVEELDYRLEADNQRLFADFYRGHPFIHVPEVVDELSTGKVLTTELAEGVRFDVLETWSQEERDLAAESIFRFVFGSLYRLHAFNGDPHPGNYLFRPGGQVTFLDFGLVKRFQPDEIVVLESMIQAMVLDRDITEYRRIITEIGLLTKGEHFTDEQIEDYFGHFYDFVLRDEVATITPEYASETVRRFFDTSGEHGDVMKAANVPPSFVIIQRINLGLYAIFGQLRATGNWRRISEELWPIVNGPPTTDLGHQAAAWMAEHPGT